MEFMHNQEDLFSSQIQLFFHETPIVSAQECTVQTKRTAKVVSGYGEDTAAGLCVGARAYKITLKKLVQVQENINFDEASSFTICLKRQGQDMIFSECEWVDITQNIVNGKAVLETITLMSTKRKMMEE